MESHLGHIQVNIDGANRPFYNQLMAFLGWPTIYEDDNTLGVGGETSLWFISETSGARNDYDGAGVNHLGIAVGAQRDVDAAATYLGEHGIAALFETPRHRPEFSGGEGQTYYQVMFESPDKLLFEVVYTGPKS